MSDFRSLTSSVFASPQIGLAEIMTAEEHGVTLIINNRPDHEEPGQITGAEIESAALAAGIGYRAIPIGPAGFGEPDIAAMTDALSNASGPVLAYCRSGTRSTLLWALSQARLGHDPEQLAAAAMAAGYDVSPVRRAMESLAAAAK